VVRAIPITGDLNLAGNVVIAGTLATTTSATSFSGVTVTANGVTPGSVLDTYINPGDSVSMALGSWSFNSGKVGLWTVGGFTFDLVSSAIVFQSAAFLSVEGDGFISGNGYDVTPGKWFFSSQGRGIAGSFSFSAQNYAQQVADSGSTFALLGLTCAGGWLYNSRQRRQA
jgi:hypothetical protein